MHESYDDITSKLGEPVWWNEDAVPRYCAFEPRRIARVYANECCLVEIACQECGQRFQVAVSAQTVFTKCPDLRRCIERGQLHYGDPPNHGENEDGQRCYAGATMNCYDLRVLEYWRRAEPWAEWARDTSLEVPLGDADAAR